MIIIYLKSKQTYFLLVCRFPIPLYRNGMWTWQQLILLKNSHCNRTKCILKLLLLLKALLCMVSIRSLYGTVLVHQLVSHQLLHQLSCTALPIKTGFRKEKLQAELFRKLCAAGGGRLLYFTVRPTNFPAHAHLRLRRVFSSDATVPCTSRSRCWALRDFDLQYWLVLLFEWGTSFQNGGIVV